MSRVQQLYQLQTLDSEVDKINRQLAEIATQLGESEALKKAKAEVEVKSMCEKLLANTIIEEYRFELSS